MVWDFLVDIYEKGNGVAAPFLNMPFSHRGWILHIAMQIDCVLTEKAGYRKLWTKIKMV